MKAFGLKAYKSQRQLLEPSPCKNPYSAECNGRHYFWRGLGPDWTQTTIGVYDPLTEQWDIKPTTGPYPPGLFYGGCTSAADCLYCFGGCDGTNRFNDLYKLNHKTLQWSEDHPSNSPSEWPFPKTSCDIVAIDDTTLGCFGGFGIDPSQPLPSSFSVDTRFRDGRGWTNEFHLFDIQRNVWSPTELKGDLPLPTSDFTFTKVDRHRAALFGGSISGEILVNSLYIFNFRIMVVTRVDPIQGKVWPCAREGHAACCLNYDEVHPKLLVSGGVDKEGKILGDMWIFDINSGKWTKVKVPLSLVPRCSHSLTATSLAPGFTKAIMFGGLFSTNFVAAETTILRFEWPPKTLASRHIPCSPTLSEGGPPSEEVNLVDVANNNTRGSSQRLRDKKERITQRSVHSLRDALRSSQQLKERLQAAEQKAAAGDVRIRTTRDEESQHEELKKENFGLKLRIYHLEEALKKREQDKQLDHGQVRDLEQQLRAAEQRVQDSEQKAADAVVRQQATQRQLEEALRQKQDIEHELQGKAKELAAHNTEVWRIPAKDVSTVRKIGSGGWGAVFEGRVKVAVKELHDEITSPHNIEKVRREMRLLAEVRHPNLVQFIGAVFDRSPPLIITELLDMNLRQAYKQNQLRPGDRLSIFIDVARALDYLHQRYEPIIYRDVSAPNVLLQRMPNNQWKGKLSDLGLANFLQNAQTMGEGAIVYSPPEVIP